jgi:rRNA-processing protein FCF1
LDGNFIFAALKHKIDIKHRLESLLQDSVRLYIMHSSLQELESLGNKGQAAVYFAKNFCDVLTYDLPSNDSNEVRTPRDFTIGFLGEYIH